MHAFMREYVRLSYINGAPVTNNLPPYCHEEPYSGVDYARCEEGADPIDAARDAFVKQLPLPVEARVLAKSVFDRAREQAMKAGYISVGWHTKTVSEILTDAVVARELGFDPCVCRALTLCSSESLTPETTRGIRDAMAKLDRAMMAAFGDHGIFKLRAIEELHLALKKMMKEMGAVPYRPEKGEDAEKRGEGAWGAKRSSDAPHPWRPNRSASYSRGKGGGDGMSHPRGKGKGARPWEKSRGKGASRADAAGAPEQRSGGWTRVPTKSRRKTFEHVLNTVDGEDVTNYDASVASRGRPRPHKRR